MAILPGVGEVASPNIASAQPIGEPIPAVGIPGVSTKSSEEAEAQKIASFDAMKKANENPIPTSEPAVATTLQDALKGVTSESGPESKQTDALTQQGITANFAGIIEKGQTKFHDPNQQEAFEDHNSGLSGTSEITKTSEAPIVTPSNNPSAPPLSTENNNINDKTKTIEIKDSSPNTKEKDFAGFKEYVESKGISYVKLGTAIILPFSTNGNFIGADPAEGIFQTKEAFKEVMRKAFGDRLNMSEQQIKDLLASNKYKQSEGIRRDENGEPKITIILGVNGAALTSFIYPYPESKLVNEVIEVNAEQFKSKGEKIKKQKEMEKLIPQRSNEYSSIFKGS